MSELKPCPFCGSEARKLMGYDFHKVTCGNELCLVRDTSFTVEQWNKRPADTVVVPRYPDAELAWRMIVAMSDAVGHVPESDPTEEELQDAVKAVTAMIAAAGGE